MTGNKEEAPVKSYELVTDDLVREALQNDKGSDVELLSWEIMPFTAKGDNYSSLVVSIVVRYDESGTEHENTYVAKLNPLRAVTPLSKSLEKSYVRETTILSDIIGGMNKELEKLGLDAIRTPRLMAKSLEKGREAFLTEDLRKQSFKMHDRMEGMDLNHCLFVLKETGRFHASSLLYEESLPSKSITDTFPCMKGSWIDHSEDDEEPVNLEILYSSSGESLSKFLMKSDPKYGKCSKWLLAHAADLAAHFKRGYQSTFTKFDVLSHGDCWTNNMLFRYNEDEIPVDFRFVDLQCSGKVSAISDLNYFLYSSLNGDFRLKNYNTLITAYYESFSEVMRKSRKEPPFSYLELKQELHNRKIYGLASGMLLLQFVLAQGDEVIDIDTLFDENTDNIIETHTRSFENMAKKEGPFKNRYLAMFEEMLDTSIFDEE